MKVIWQLQFHFEIMFRLSRLLACAKNFWGCYECLSSFLYILIRCHWYKEWSVSGSEYTLAVHILCIRCRSKCIFGLLPNVKAACYNMKWWICWHHVQSLQRRGISACPRFCWQEELHNLVTPVRSQGWRNVVFTHQHAQRLEELSQVVAGIVLTRNV
jgi:hypothetical protein